MIIGEHKEIEKIDIAGNFNSVEASIDDSSMTFMFEMLSKSLYSKPIESIVRELTSNCFDSHKEANVDKAVVINYKSDEEGDFISFQDFGVGLSPERIQSVYMKYFSSTKRGSNEQIGGFGLGSKTPLAYTDYFYINTNFDGIAYQYIFSKGESKPTLDLLDEKETIEGNGTEVKIYIKNRNDYHKFQNALLTELCYFDNVYFNNWDIENDYKIYETETFKYRNKAQYSDELHLILGKVSYPVNWDELGLDNRIKIPIGVKFEIGEFQVTPNRESIRYTDESKLLIKQKINAALDELRELYQDDTMLYDNWKDFRANENARPYILLNKEEIELDKLNEIPFNIKEDKLYLTGLKENKAVYKPFYELGIHRDNYQFGDLLNYLYTWAGKINEPDKIINKYGRVSVFDKFYHNNSFVVSNNKQFVNIRNLKFRGRDIFVENKIDKYFIRKVGDFVIKGFDADEITGERNKPFSYFNLGLSIKVYKIYKALKREIEHLLVDYNQELTEEDNLRYKNWLNEKNALSIERKNLGKFPCKDIIADEYGNEAKYDLKIQDVLNYNGIIIYGFLEDERKLRFISTEMYRFKSLKCLKLVKPSTNKGRYKIKFRKTYVTRGIDRKFANSRFDTFEPDCLNPQAIKVIRIAKNNEKYFKKPNMIHVDKFNSNNKMFRKLATTYLIEKVLKELIKHQSHNNNDYIVEIMKEINTTIGDHLEALFEYVNDFRLVQPTMRTHSQDFWKFKDEILEIAKMNNWWDESIMHRLTEVKNWFNGIEILKYVDLNEQSMPVVLKYLFDKKKKLNYEYYAKYVRPELFENQLVIDFEPKEEITETKLFHIVQQVA